MPDKQIQKAEKLLNELASLLNTKELSYNDEAKQKYARIGRAAFRALAGTMPFVEVDVRFNAGGIAVSGDLTLHGMFADGTGIYMNLNQHSWDGSKVSCYCRSVKSMKDYTGGRNNWVSGPELQNVKKLIQTLIATAKEPARI